MKGTINHIQLFDDEADSRKRDHFNYQSTIPSLLRYGFKGKSKSALNFVFKGLSGSLNIENLTWIGPYLLCALFIN